MMVMISLIMFFSGSGNFLVFTKMSSKQKMLQAKRVCVIGAGPSGMSVLYQFDQLRKQGKKIPEIVCYDAQSDWGGLWKYSWRTGINEYGEPEHGSMYQGLWSNGPKECLEFPDYTFEDHYGKPIPSFPPREVLFDYLKGRWSKGNLRPWITFNHLVQRVTYNDSTDDFSVVVKNLPEDKALPAERFDYIVVCPGVFSVPKTPSFPGIDQFPGRVIHSHDFRNAIQFKGRRLLVIGSSYSAEDLAIQCLKFGAKNIVCCWRTKSMGFKWPPQIQEKPLLTKIEGNTVHFKDDTTAEVDDIILCTGYHYSFPFLEERLRLKSNNVLFPEGLYKATLWTKGGNNKVLYIGALDQYYTYTIFDAQAKWAVNYITGELKLPDKETMENDCKTWIAKNHECKNGSDEIDFQTAHLADLVKESNYGHDLDTGDMFHDWHHHKDEDITKYRDKSFASKFTGNKSPLLRTPFMQEFDDSLQSFISN